MKLDSPDFCLDDLRSLDAVHQMLKDVCRTWSESLPAGVSLQFDVIPNRHYAGDARIVWFQLTLPDAPSEEKREPRL